MKRVAPLTEPGEGASAVWIAEILDQWVPPEDYDERMAAVVDGYLADQGDGSTQWVPEAQRRSA